MILSIVDEITDFISNVKLVFTETFNFLPSELYSVFVVIIGLAVGFYIYRLVR